MTISAIFFLVLMSGYRGEDIKIRLAIFVEGHSVTIYAKYF